MLNVLIIGVGEQGKRIAQLISECPNTIVHLYDQDFSKLDGFDSKFQIYQKRPYLELFDIIVDCLPSYASHSLLLEAGTLGKTVISVSFLEEDFMQLNNLYRQEKGLLIPDCGAAPGMSHLLAAHAVCLAQSPHTVVMKVGAIPLNPQPPFYHNLTWSLNDLIEEYKRPAKVRYNGTEFTENPLSTIKSEKIFNLKLESFITDGLRSFLNSYPTIPRMEERTYRHKGHLEYMSSLENYNNLEQFYSLDKSDQFIMSITAIGRNYIEITYQMLNLPALVNSVAASALAAYKLIQGGFYATGVNPLEKMINYSPIILDKFIEMHRELGANIGLTINEKNIKI